MPISSVNQTDIEAFHRLVCDSPANPLKPWQRTKRPTKTKFVASIAADVIQMRHKGYSTEEIAQLISTHLFEISPDELRALLNYIGVSLRTSLAAFCTVDPIEREACQDNRGQTDLMQRPQQAREPTLDKDASVPGFSEVLLLGKAAKTKVQKLAPTDAALFRQMVDALEPGRQTIRIPDGLDHVARNLVAAGLLRVHAAVDSGVYEIPETVARIVLVPREARAAA
jgi:hypothetical protein